MRKRVVVMWSYVTAILFLLALYLPVPFAWWVRTTPAIISPPNMTFPPDVEVTMVRHNFPMRCVPFLYADILESHAWLLGWETSHLHMRDGDFFVYFYRKRPAHASP